MTEPISARKSPFQADLVAGKKYAWCARGRSQNQPFRDGCHSGTGLTPVVFRAEETQTVWFYGCKRTASKPFRDGTHNSL